MKDRKDHVSSMKDAAFEGGRLLNELMEERHPNGCQYCLAWVQVLITVFSFQAKFGEDETKRALHTLAETLPDDDDPEDPIGETAGSA